ncbi:MAG: hypothetical protein JW855_03750 [Gammaproteobacteria bacterium]|nr:hypothetical protein [Gammaproteobacteria bacterium]
MKRIYFFVLLLILFSTSLTSTLAYAIPLASLSTLIPFPPKVFVNTTALARYQITNNVDGTLPFQITYPAGLVRGAGSSCGASLPSGASCLLNLEFSPTTVPQSINGKLAVKFQDGSGVYSNINMESANNIPDAPTLVVQGSPDIVLIPASTTTVTVKNQSATTAANNVQIHLPPEIASEVENVTSCPNIAPNATCDIHLSTKTDAAQVDQKDTIIQGSNTPPVNVTITVTNVLSYDSPLNFDKPYSAPPKELEVTNKSPKTVQIDSLSWPSTPVQGVQLPSSIPSACQSLAPGASCELPFTADHAAYGNGSAQIAYHFDGISRTQPLDILVAPTTIKVNDNKDIILAQGLSNIFTIENTGPFDWQSPFLRLDNPIAGVTLLDNTCDVSVIPVTPPNNKCEISFELDNPQPGDAGDLYTNGENLIPSLHDLVVVQGALAIVPELANDKLHLSYRAIRVENAYDPTVSVKLNTISTTLSSSLNNKVSVCATSGGDCVYHSTCEDGTILTHQGDSCNIWLKSTSKDDEPLGKIPGTATVNVDMSFNHVPKKLLKQRNLKSTISKTLEVDYGQDLYAGGNFYTAGGIEVYNIAKWNGSNWAALSSGVLGSAVEALTQYNGDLYAGGNFSMAGGIPANRIAKWDGMNWSPLSSGVNSIVSALAQYNGDLYVGGHFTSAGGNSANRVAKWDGINWSALSSGVNSTVRALASYNNDLYVGGDFTSAGGASANYIAKWDGTNWFPLLSPLNGMNAPVYGLRQGDGSLYVGGEFSHAGGPLFVSHIAKWDGANWSAFGIGTDNLVRDLIYYNSKLYAGGDFLLAGGSLAYNIAKWDGAWSDLDSGVDLPVHTLASHNTDIYAGGEFNGAVGPLTLVANRIAKWNGSNWSALGTGMNGAYDVVNKILIAPSLEINQIP